MIMIEKVVNSTFNPFLTFFKLLTIREILYVRMKQSVSNCLIMHRFFSVLVQLFVLSLFEGFNPYKVRVNI